MPATGWRFVVLADFGSALKDPVRLKPEDPAALLAQLQPAAEVGGQPGGTSRRLSFPDERSFLPEALGPGEIDPVLHHPAFQRIESAYRGVKFLQEHAKDAIQIDVVSTSQKDLLSRFREKVYEPELSELRDPPLSLVVLDFDFTHQPADVALLSELGGLARMLQAPVVAGASPAFFGLRQLQLLPKLSDISQRLADGGHGAWQKFQKQDEARWISLTLNRTLQRLPHPQEKSVPGAPESWLWGRGVWLLGAAAARSIRAHGHALDLSGARAGGFSGLPVWPLPKSANESVPLSTEVEISDEKMQELSRAGFVPVCGRVRSDVAMIPIAVNLYRNAPGRLTASGTLGYQLLAGRLAQITTLRLGEMPPDPQAALPFLKETLLAVLGPLAGEDREKAVEVKLLPPAPAAPKAPPQAEVTVVPAAKIEGVDFRLTFQVPLSAGG
jgi:hypothetical protein